MKIVINDCYGGFSLSYEAIALYLATKSQKAYFYAELRGSSKNTFKKFPLNKLKEAESNYYYIYCTTEDQGDELNHFPTSIFNDRDIDRTDRDLISVVEFLGPKVASGRYANLKITDITDGSMYRINTYDGAEEIEYRDNIGWEIANSKHQNRSIHPSALHLIYDKLKKGNV